MSAVPPGRPVFLCLSHLRWGFVYQRPQHLLARAARTHDVIFLEEPVLRPPAPDLPRLEWHDTPEGVRIAVPLLPEGLNEAATDAAQRRLLDGLLAEAAPGGVAVAWYYTPMALAFSAHVKAGVTVYDCMDELSAFRGASPRLQLLERRLMKAADVVFTGGRSLYEAKRGLHANVHAFPSGVDVAHFAAAMAPGRAPADADSIPAPRLGWFGVIDERMDLGLLDRCAALRPDWSFVMIGPVVKIDPASLPRRPNIHWLGARPHAALPGILAGWDVGFMPFALNESTRFISPTKTPEYVAAGVPVVSTAIRDVVRDWGSEPYVRIAATAEAAVAAAEALMALPRGSWRPGATARLEAASWDGTWARMLAAIRAAERGEGLRPAVPTTGTLAAKASHV